MTEKQLYVIYKAARGGANKPENPDSSAAWKAVLLRFDRDELQAALEAWWADTAPAQGVMFDKPKGATMPTPADLKARVIAARQLIAAKRRFEPCNRRFTREGKQYGCDDGRLRIRIPEGFWELTGEKCSCLHGWEKLTIPEVTHA